MLSEIIISDLIWFEMNEECESKTTAVKVEYLGPKYS